MATTPGVNLTPFGFTPTESLVYSALSELGPTTAYALSKRLSLARANAYQALNGLRAKGAAALIESDPQVFRASNPNALLVMITEREMEKLDRLESQLSRPPDTGVPETQPFSSERAFREIALRTALRAKSIQCVASGAVLRSLNPIWRKRAADGAGSGLWAVDDDIADIQSPVTGTVSSEAVSVFGWEPVLVLTDDAAIVGKRTARQLEGYWTSDPIFCALVRGTMARLTGQDLTYRHQDNIN